MKDEKRFETHIWRVEFIGNRLFCQCFLLLVVTHCDFEVADLKLYGVFLQLAYVQGSHVHLGLRVSHATLRTVVAKKLKERLIP